MELKERLTARPLKVAEYEHQFKNESQGTERNRDEGDDAKGHQTGIPQGTEKI